MAPVFLDLVTVAAEHAIMTWYTGAPGTDDGTGRMEPAAAEGEVWFGTDPARLTGRAHGLAGTPYHYAELQGSDCFRDGWFAAGERTYFTAELGGLRLIGLDTYDKPGNGGDNGAMSAGQVAWLADVLLSDPDRPTLVFGHHPLQVDGPLAHAPGKVLDPAQAARMIALYRQAPGVFLYHAGHTHRNRRTTLFPGAHGSPMVQQEVSAVKEYPGGFMLLRLHEGGYALNFYKQRDELAREWRERTRQELKGLFPQIAFGSAVTDRNSVASWDFSALR